MEQKQNILFPSTDHSTRSFKRIPTPHIKVKKQQKETKIQIAFCDWVKKVYPEIIFSCDLSSGMRLPLHIAGMHKRMRSSRGHTDFFSAEPRGTNYAFFLELKKDIDEVYLKDGLTFKKCKTPIKKAGKIVGYYDHIQEQWDMICKLRERGYYADFGLGLQDCKDKFTAYMSQK